MEELFSLDAIMHVYQQNEMPNGQDLYGWNTFAQEVRKFPDWYTWRKHQLTRIIGDEIFAFKKIQINPHDLGDFRLGGFQGLLKYYKDYLDESNFLLCPQARINRVISAENLQGDPKLEAIKSSIRSGVLKETNLIGLSKGGVSLIQDGTCRALAITQMIHDGEEVPLVINWYVHQLHDTVSYPYVDYYPQES